MTEHPLDWSSLGLENDPAPGSAEVLRRTEQDFRRLGDEARGVNAGLDALLRAARSDGFRGATAEALRGEISGRLKMFIANVAASFDVAVSGVSRYRAALESVGQAISAALDSARGLAPDDPQVAVAREGVWEQREWLVAEGRVLERSLHDAAEMVSQPVKVDSGWLRLLETLLAVTAMVVSVVGIFTGGWIAVAGWALSAALFMKSAVEVGVGRGSWLDLALAGVGFLFPSTKGIGFGWLKAALNAAMREGSSGLRGVGVAAVAVGRTISSPTLMAGLIRAGVVVRPELLAGAGARAFRAIRGIPGAVGRTASAVPSLVSSAGGFVKGMWHAGVTAVHGDFLRVTGQVGGMASKLGTYAVVNMGRAFDLAVTAVTPLHHGEIATLGYQGACHAAFVERGLSTMAGGRFGSMAGRGAHAVMSGLDLTEPGLAARVVEAASPPGLVPSAAGLGLARGPDTVPDLGAGRRGLPLGGEPGAVPPRHAAGRGLRLAPPDDRAAARMFGSGRSAPSAGIADAGEGGRGAGPPGSGGQSGPAAVSADSALGRQVELDESLGLERGNSGLLLPADLDGAARTGGGLLVAAAPAGAARVGDSPVLAGLDRSHAQRLLDGDFELVTAADDALTLRIGQPGGASVSSGPVRASPVAGPAGGEAGRSAGAGDVPAGGGASLAPATGAEARSRALALLAAGRAGADDATTGDGLGGVVGTRLTDGVADGLAGGVADGVAGGAGGAADSASGAGRVGQAGGHEGLDSAGASSVVADGRALGREGAAGLDRAGRAVPPTSGFEPVGLHEAARLGTPGGQERLTSLSVDRTVDRTAGGRLNTATGPVASGVTSRATWALDRVRAEQGPSVASPRPAAPAHAGRPAEVRPAEVRPAAGAGSVVTDRAADRELVANPAREQPPRAQQHARRPAEPEPERRLTAGLSARDPAELRTASAAGARSPERDWDRDFGNPVWPKLIRDNEWDDAGDVRANPLWTPLDEIDPGLLITGNHDAVWAYTVTEKGRVLLGSEAVSKVMSEDQFAALLAGVRRVRPETTAETLRKEIDRLGHPTIAAEFEQTGRLRPGRGRVSGEFRWNEELRAWTVNDKSGRYMRPSFRPESGPAQAAEWLNNVTELFSRRLGVHVRTLQVRTAQPAPPP